jgi:transketolase
MRGGYILRPASSEGSGGVPRIILIGTGSELQLAFHAAELLETEGIPARVVSLPCWELFEAQAPAYRDLVLPPAVRARVSIEAGASLGWERWVGDAGAIIGIDHFGASAPAGTIFSRLGFTVERVAEVARAVLRGDIRGPIPTLDAGHQPLGITVARQRSQHPQRWQPTPTPRDASASRAPGADPGHR